MEFYSHNKILLLILYVFLLPSFNTLALRLCQCQGTRVGFYRTTCPRAEAIVQSVVQSAVRSNPTIAPGLLRMFNHDCFVNGCDASVLLDGTSAEKTASANSNLRGFEVIDAAKSQLETVCPGVVSCADILALAARDSVVVSGGRSWAMPTGRRDGLVSRESDVTNLPGFNDSVDVQVRKFADKGLDTKDLVALVGAHTIGTAACGFFRHRLYNFNNTNGPDPTIDPAFLPQLQSQCPDGGDGSRRVELDAGSVNNFDSSYYANLRRGRGVLTSDAVLWNDQTTQRFVQQFLGASFDTEFGRAMVKMGNIEVKTGNQGEIRRVCNRIN